MKKTILLIDDDFAVLAALAGVFVSEGYHVIHAVDGQEGVEKFRGHSNIDAVLLDINMPRKNGWEVFAEIMQINPLVPVIVVTARPAQYPAALNAGVGALLEKPLEIPTLLATIQSLTNESLETKLTRFSRNEPKTAFYPAAHGQEAPVVPAAAARHISSYPISRPAADRSAGVEGGTEERVTDLVRLWLRCSADQKALFLKTIEEVQNIQSRTRKLTKTGRAFA